MDDAMACRGNQCSHAVVEGNPCLKALHHEVNFHRNPQTPEWRAFLLIIQVLHFRRKTTGQQVAAVVAVITARQILVRIRGNPELPEQQL